MLARSTATLAPLLLLAWAATAPRARGQDQPPDGPPPAAEPAPEEAPPTIPDAAWAGLERKPVRLAHRFTAGQVLGQRIRQRMELDQGALGHMTTDMVLTAAITTRAAGAEGVELELRYRDVVYELDANGQTFALDTRDGTTSGNPVVDALAGMVGVPLRMDARPDGRVEKVTGAGKLVDAIVGRCPPEVGPQLRAQLEQNMNDDQLASTSQESLIVFPDRELRPGDAWHRTYTAQIQPIGAVDYRADYVFLGTAVRDGVAQAKLLLRTRCRGVQARESLLQPGLTAVMDMDAFEGTTSVWVRLADGALVEQEPLTLRFGLKIAAEGEVFEMRYHMIQSTAHAPEAEKPAPAGE